MSSHEGKKKHVALIGDSGCGKTALAVRLSTGLFLNYYLPTQLVDDFSAQVDTGKNGTCKLTLLDLSGSFDDEEGAGVRALAYSKCDAIVVCFDLSSEESLESVTERWIPELEAACPGVPFLIAGCKQDKTCACQCDGPCPELAAAHETVKDVLIRTRTARAYVEVSSKYSDGLDELAQLVLEVAHKKRAPVKKLAASIKGSLKKLSFV